MHAPIYIQQSKLWERLRQTPPEAWLERLQMWEVSQPTTLLPLSRNASGLKLKLGWDLRSHLLLVGVWREDKGPESQGGSPEARE